jgi:hypothetical protein
MLRLLRWLFRPAVLIVVSALLVAAAALIVFRPVSGAVRPQRLPLRAGDSEIAFIYPATNGAAWDRFVGAVRRTCDRLQETYPGMTVHEHAAPGGAGGTATAEVVLAWPGNSRRIVFRWYKLTSDWTADAWMKELLQPPYPLAVIGGGNSTWARELALTLRDAGAGLPEKARPLLLITTATADRVADPSAAAEAAEPLTGLVDAGKYHPAIYEGRTYRFCFTNRQMATAVTRFVWTQPDLCPDGDPVYLVQWMDDSYSRDLFEGYARVLPHRTTEDVLQRASFAAGCFGLGVAPPALAGWWTSGVRQEGEGVPYRIPSGVGSFSSPNPYEAESSRHLLDELKKSPDGSRHLLVVTGQAQPSRRFLIDVARSWPDASRRLVVASGDAIPFNTIYRDRLITWHIQDLPFKLVLFCHRNPIYPGAGFLPIDAQSPRAARPSAQSGTEDLLLFADVAEAVALAHGADGVRDASGLAAGLDRLNFSEGRLTFEQTGRPLFHPRNKGMRNSGTGEHVVCLRPVFEGERVRPEATVEVWYRSDVEGTPYRRVGPPLPVSYVERKAFGD